MLATTSSYTAAAIVLANLAAVVHAQSSGASAFTPLASQSFTYTALPYQADTGTGERGPQSGYNICNSTTENQQSKCQTAIINSIDDFCLWAPQDPNSVIGNVEGECVAWCTKPGHGTRLIPAGALTAVQFMKTPDYVQVTGLINQALINIAPNDDGGELDPHGADQRGNPLGGLVFSNAFPASNGNANNYVQAIEWHNFMGGSAFCLKACDPSRPNAARLCEHVFDRIGCQYNAPAAYAPNVFESCLGDSQDFPGVYTGANGVVSTYSQPPESLGAITAIPYTPRIPASSSCTPYTSSAIYTANPSASISTSTSSSSSTSRTGTTSRSTSTRTVTPSSTSTPGAGFVSAKASPVLALFAALAGFAMF
ncbi:hypothetical protein PIIN_04527 [Serendipita indica DSM 11827]|uniref:Macrofage activating glycoprotein n=1 Tax=Serendipita indica (strain DSM 11827) TaxID=1109443 RepID=G4TGW9_SERID|nr:hypothetical protein PIIN_04527 [Serendipita indica DSM 11827]